MKRRSILVALALVTGVACLHANASSCSAKFDGLFEPGERKIAPVLVAQVLAGIEAAQRGALPPNSAYAVYAIAVSQTEARLLNQREQLAAGREQVLRELLLRAPVPPVHVVSLLQNVEDREREAGKLGNSVATLLVLYGCAGP